MDLARGAHKEAEAGFRALASETNRAGDWAALGAARAALGLHDSAAASFRRSLRAEPSGPGADAATIGLARSLLEEGDVDDACNFVESVLRRDPQHCAAVVAYAAASGAGVAAPPRGRGPEKSAGAVAAPPRGRGPESPRGLSRVHSAGARSRRRRGGARAGRSAGAGRGPDCPQVRRGRAGHGQARGGARALT